jgi:type I restriction enzyme S subunit
MSSDKWNTCKFREIFLVPLKNGVSKPSKVRGDGVKMVNMKEIFAYDRIGDIEMERVPMTPKELDNYTLKNGDLLFARQSLIASGAGKCSLYLGKTEQATWEGHLIRARLNSKICDSVFYYYYFKSGLGRSKVESLILQTAAAGIRASELAELEVDLPPLSTQRRIAATLTSLDDKIELNRRMNETLEGIAQALWGEWFGKYASGEEELPQGWSEFKLGDLVETVSKTYKFTKDRIIFLNTSDILDGQVLTNEFSAVANLPGQAKKSIRKEDILYSEIRPSNKRYAYIHFDAAEYVVSTKLMVLRSKGIFDPLLIYFFLTRNEILDHLQMLAESRSGTFPQITFDHVKTLKFRFSDKKHLEKFTSLLKPIYENKFKNEAQSRTLTALRDALLPRLMRGEVLS